ncbi:AAEL008581-PC [Aedes aegypti]|uniref:AAEL008581-PA n=1 Tax=Aedes aegypti TaxID=7159 RepID=A6KVN1_AEDAE|nr:AAEL008581-PA [Aedes aegypti]EAT39627.1 AAEL008581-PB [Aedes aegypti]EAT39628.1 AAEL008581-PC [Aedes aegypti]
MDDQSSLPRRRSNTVMVRTQGQVDSIIDWRCRLASAVFQCNSALNGQKKLMLDAKNSRENSQPELYKITILVLNCNHISYTLSNKSFEHRWQRSFLKIIYEQTFR